MHKPLQALALSAACLLSYISNAMAFDISKVSSAIAEFQPMGIEFVEEKIRIAVPQAQVSEQQYALMIKGICYLQWSGELSLSPLKEVIILNENAWSGWVLETPGDACDTLGKKNSDEFSPSLMSFTHLASQGW
ncbi:hypothetical protein FDK21_19270 [Cohaesibacter sp. CAU 1516]|uniref:hypothetical protein n=1 Tax=Cohaesibacter sp. CAU 1516 TaxID=2576038 RepID=UPI0010FD2376|nr:hypothetical protein [Cohaesibacter sp. CAU 1516]TLP42655.1 hypothetical protein FDK21_19270 [Cohaesibacter sp. CAU 1516]